MAINVAKLTKVYGAMVTEKLRQNLVYAGLCSRSYQARLQTVRSVQIPTSANTVTATAWARNGDWKSLQASDIKTQDFAIDQFGEVGNKIDWLDQVEAPIDVVADVADDHAFALAEYIDNSIRDAMIAAVPAGNTETLGVATDYINDDGTPSSDAALELVYNAIDVMATSAAKNKIGITGRGPVRRLWVVMDAARFRPFRNFLVEKGLNGDLGPAAFRDQEGGDPPNGYVGRAAGANILVVPTIPEVSVGGKKHARILMGTRRATEFASRPGITQRLTPETNQTGPYHALRRVQPFGRKVVQTNQLYIAQVRKEA